METLKKYWYAFVVMLIGIVFFLIAIFIDTRLGEIALGMVNMSIGIIFFFLLDKYFLKDVDTIEEIKKGNTAVGYLFIAYAIMFAAAQFGVGF